jgi:pilus assembly protein CpaC
MLKVRFAEVSRNALQELGASLFSDGNNNLFGRTSTQQFAAPFFDKGQPMLGESLVFSDYLNLFLFDAKNKIGAVVKAMQSAGVFQSLAEPNLIALNGKEASFLAGGEFPYPVPQGQFGSFTIHFKEYGVRLSFTPTVLGGDLINLKIKPEVSSLDFNNAVVIEGFRIPALTSRRAETEVELQDGQTFAIAGLLNNAAVSSMRKVPVLGDIPILGTLFKSRAYQKDQTELVVMVTPTIVRKGSTGVSSGLPSLVEPFLGPNEKPLAPPPPYVGSPLYPVNPGAVPVPATQPVPTSAPAAANGTVPVQDPVPSTPIQSPAAMPASPTPVMTEKERKAQQAEEERQAKAAEAEEQRQAEADKAAAKKAEEERKKAEKIEKERAKKQAELDKKAAEEAEKAAIKKAEEDRRKNAEEEKRNKSVAEAAARLKQAQEAYQAEVSRTNKGGVK